MEIEFVYPDMTASEFEDAVEDLNNTISDRNTLSFLPRAFSGVFAFFMYALTGIAIYLTWVIMVFLITGRDPVTVYIGLGLMVAVMPAAMSLQKRAAPALKGALLSWLKLHDYEEKFTFMEYADRDEKAKKVDKSLKYYQFCDEIRAHKVVDATVNYNGVDCEVDISFNDEATGTGLVRRIKLPVRAVAGMDHIIVDFERRLVCCPEDFV